MLKRSLLVLFVFLLCTAVFGQRRGAWNKIASADELVGTWEGSRVMQIPKNAQINIPKSSLLVTFTMDYTSGDTIILSMTMDLNQFLNDWITVPQIKQAGITKDQLWELMLGGFASLFEEAFTNSDYTLVIPITGPVEDLISGDDMKAELNRERTKLCLTFPEKITLGMGDAGFQDVILDKK